jgi:hypothetical protein
MESFNLKKVNAVEGKEQYHVALYTFWRYFTMLNISDNWNIITENMHF